MTGTGLADPGVASAPATRTAASPLPREAPFVGRAARVADMQAAWHAGQLLLVTGEAGEGKTRLATDFAAVHGAYAHIACRLVDRDLPFAAAARVLRALLEASDVTLADPTRSELARVLPELGSTPPLASGADRLRFFAAVADAVRQLTVDNFSALVIDDWHNADASSQALLLHVAQQPAPQLRWLFAYRGSEVSAEARQSLDALVAAGAARRIDVAPLTVEEVGALVRALSRSEAPLFAHRLQRATGGNPFFLLETLRHLFERGLITVSRAGQWQTPFDAETTDYRELPLPPTVRDAVRARVARLGEGAVRLLEAASLVGDPFETGWLDDTSSLTETETVAALESAEAASLLQREGAAYRFAHDLVPQSLLAGLSPARRALLHRRLALNLERVRAAPARIAAHWEAAGEPRRAVAHRLAAGEAAAHLYAHREALAEFAQGLADGPDTAQEVRLRNARIDALRHLGDLQARAAETEALLALARASGDRNLEADAAIQRALSLADAGRKRDALRAAAHAVTLGPTDETALLRALRIAGWAAMTCGESEQARGFLEQALPLAERIDASAACSSLSVLVRIAIDAGRYEEAARIYERARSHPGLTLRPMIHNQVLADGARLAEATGDRDVALALQREALAIAERVGATPSINIARINLMAMLLNAGRLDEAEAQARHFEPFRERHGHPLEQYIGLSAAAQLAAFRGDWAAAGQWGERVVQLTDRNDDPLQQRYERVRLARVRLAAGDPAAARELARAAQGIDPQPGRVLLSAAVVEARADLDLAPACARDVAVRLEQLPDAAPVLEEERPYAVDDARLVRGWALLRLDQPEAALAAAAPVRFSVGLRAEALAIELHALRRLARPEDAARAEAAQLIAGVDLPAAERCLLVAALDGLQATLS